MFDAERFCQDHGIDYDDHNSHRGWIHISCPYCNDTSYHLGINTKQGYTKCWRCQYHWLPKIVAEITGQNIGRAQNTIANYSEGETLNEYRPERPSEILLPNEFKKLDPLHYGYLKARQFAPHVARKWGLLGTGSFGAYSHRIIIPIYLDGVLISFQGRDISGLSTAKYKACQEKDEVYPHQQSLYGIDFTQSKSTVVIVEGVTDVWRLGPGAVATFGIEWTTPQARMIANRFKKFSILFDAEPQAQEQGEKLYQYLTGRGLKGELAILEKEGMDPGSLTNKQARSLMDELTQ